MYRGNLPRIFRLNLAFPFEGESTSTVKVEGIEVDLNIKSAPRNETVARGFSFIISGKPI